MPVSLQDLARAGRMADEAGAILTDTPTLVTADGFDRDAVNQARHLLEDALNTVDLYLEEG